MSQEFPTVSLDITNPHPWQEAEEEKEAKSMGSTS